MELINNTYGVLRNIRLIQNYKSKNIYIISFVAPKYQYTNIGLEYVTNKEVK